MAHATLSSKNQIVIPREAREALRVKAGDKLLEIDDKQRKELKKLVGKLDLKSTSRELVLLTRARRWRKRR